MTVGQRIKSLRDEHGITQERFAAVMGVGQSTIAMYETGKREPNLATLDAIADFFNVDMDYLLGKSDCPNRYQADQMLSALERELLANFRKLDRTNQEAVMQIVAQMASTQKNSAVSDVETAQ